ncbi:MAG TPA: CBS domain-containing protein, partial [Candidatus Binataceae bacterium]|nr:CBS domain-containing protein [Candidatus Binataceae bacterium]
PAMVATIAALIVARQIESESIDTYRLAREGKTLHIAQERLALSQIPVSAVMRKDVTTLAENTSLEEVLRIAGETSQVTLSVVNSEGIFRGLIITRDLLALLIRDKEVSPLINAFDICVPHAPTIRPDVNLDVASDLMESEGIDEIPVTDKDRDGRFLGIVTRHHMAQALNRVAVSMSSMAPGDTNIYWATGYRVTRLEVPGASQGLTVRGLDPRARFGVTVLALREVDNPGAGFVPISPDRALKAGDLLVTAGRAADLRRFARALADTPPKVATA